MAQLKNLIVNGASRFLTPIKGDLSGTSDYSLKMETYKQGSSTETYGASYPLWAQWETNNILKLLCTGYSTKVDMANTLATARTIRTNLASTSTASFNGSANITPGVTGTLAVGNGGTGATTFTSTAALVGNGTSAISASNLKISGYEAALTSSSTDATRYVATNSYGSVSLWASENRGVYDHTNSKWIIASKQDSSKTYVPRWASLGGTAKPVYFDSDGSAVACSSTVGSTDTPVYMNAGTITTTGKKFSDYVTLATEQTISGTKTFSSNITINTASARVKFTHSTSNNTGFVGISTDGANLGLYDSINSKYVIYTNYSDTYIPRWASIGNSTTPIYFNSSGKATACSRSIPRVYLASECTSYTSDDNVSTCTPAAVKKAVSLFGDDLYVSLTKNQTITGNKTFNSATYFGNINVRPTTANTGYLGTMDYPWSQMVARYIYSRYNGATYGYLRPYAEGTTSQIGNGRLTLGNDTAEGTAGNARGSLVLYGGGTTAAIITGYDGYISITFG